MAARCVIDDMVVSRYTCNRHGTRCCGSVTAQRGGAMVLAGDLNSGVHEEVELQRRDLTPRLREPAHVPLVLIARPVPALAAAQVVANAEDAVLPVTVTPHDAPVRPW